MSEDYCPFCYTSLEVKDVAPCMDCGALEEELDHALKGKHTYAEMRIFDNLILVLCNFCMLDFGSYAPTYLACPQQHKLAMGTWTI